MPTAKLSSNLIDVQYQLLNPEQVRAVDHVDGPMLVLAGAGTGKTQIIALRIARLLQTQDLKPSNILCLTFTESGVQAMRQRLVSLLGSIGYQVRVHTFHSFCNEVIIDHPELFVAQAALQQITDLDHITLIQEIIETLPADSLLKPFGAPDFYISEIVHAIQTLKREHVSPDDLAKFELTEKQQALVEVYRAYQVKLQDQQLYDYEDMLLHVIAVFKKDPDLLAEYREQYLHLLVDEYQDTNNAQNEIINLLAGNDPAPNVFVVGDDKQSIYRFQGAALENILSFQHRYGKAAKLISLQQNYRSQQWILDAASAVIDHNEQSLAKYIPELKSHLKSARDLPTVPLEIATLSSPSTELFWVGKRIQALLANGVAPEEIAVLYRTNSDGEAILETLRQLNIPVHSVSGRNILSDPLIQQLLRLFQYISYGDSDANLFSLVHARWLGLHNDKLLQLTDPVITEFKQRVVHWRSAMHNDLCTEWFTQIVNESSWLRYVLQHDHAIEHLNRLSSLYHAVVNLTRREPTITIKNVLDYFQLLQHHDLTLEEEPLSTQANAVQLMTAHRAKGLEFKHVFMIHCRDKHWGNVPDRSKLKLPEGIIQLSAELAKHERNEDERRLFYVAMTRAKEHLYLSVAKQSATGRALMPSQFLNELPSDIVKPADGVAEVEAEPIERLQLTLSQPKVVIETNQVYLKSLLENYRMSATHLNDYLECPIKFLYQDLLRVPQTMSRAVGFGVAMHNTLKELPSQADVFLIFKRELEKQLMSKKDFKDSLDFGEKLLDKYYPVHYEFLQKNKFMEKDFKPYNCLVGEVPIVGKIDAIQVVDEASKQIHVIDYKTGNPDNKSANLAVGGSYYRQLVFYKLLCDAAGDFGYTPVSGEIHFIQPSKKKQQFVHRRYEFSDDDVKQVTTELVETYQHIQNLEFSTGCNDCEWCKLL